MAFCVISDTIIVIGLKEQVPVYSSDILRSPARLYGGQEIHHALVRGTRKLDILMLTIQRLLHIHTYTLRHFPAPLFSTTYIFNFISISNNCLDFTSVQITTAGHMIQDIEHHSYSLTVSASLITLLSKHDALRYASC